MTIVVLMVIMSPVMPPYEKPKTAYDFITKPPTQQKKPAGLGGKIALIAGGGVAAVILLFIVLSVFTGGSDTTQRIITAAQQQTELARVATLGVTTGSQASKNVALNVSMSLTTDQQKLVAVLQENGVKVKQKQLAAGVNAETDQQLAAAKAAANFDETFLQILDEQLAAYQASLQEAYDNSKNEEVRQVLSDSFAHAKLLRTQIEQTKL